MSIIKAPSLSNPDLVYEIDTKKGTCSCPAFKKGFTRPCKHMKAAGIDSVEEMYLKSMKQVDPSKAKPIYTIGHSNHKLLSFMETLQETGITCLIDVRSVPFSKYNPQFNKDTLETACANRKIKYVSGGKIMGGRNSISVKDPVYIEKLNRIISLASTDNVALMCSEKNPAECHRAYKISPQLLDRGCEVRHITTQGIFDGQEFQDSVDDGEWIDYGKDAK